MSDLFTLLPQAAAREGPWALVTLVEARGSTYRKTGAHLLVQAGGGTLGALSGGCLEAEVAARCAPVLASEVASLELFFDTRRLLGCDGRISLVVEPLPSGLTAEVAGIARQRRPATLYTHRPGPDWQPTSTRNDQAAIYAHELLPPLRLLVIGSGPGAIPLLQMAGVLGWQAQHMVLASDPAVRRYPAADWRIITDARSLTSGEVDERTVCVVMNHHVGRDSEVLRALWNTPTPYLSLVGSRRRRDSLLEALAFSGESVDLESRTLYAPAGLDLDAESPAEIALEICAQIQQTMVVQASHVLPENKVSTEPGCPVAAL